MRCEVCGCQMYKAMKEPGANGQVWVCANPDCRHLETDSERQEV